MSIIAPECAPTADDVSPRAWRFVSGLYWAHLAALLAVALDLVVILRSRGPFVAFGSGAVCVGTAAWVLLTTCFYAWSARRGRARVVTATLGIYSILLCMVLLELTTRAYEVSIQRTWTLYAPGFTALQQHDLTVMPGVSAVSRFSANSLGLRGPEPPTGPGAYRIVAVGGSTTECWSLDDKEVWTQLVMDRIQAASAAPEVWVANAGVAGYTTVHHLAFLTQMRAVRSADAVLLLVGINDLTAAVSSEGRATQDLLESNAGVDDPPRQGFLLRRSASYRYVRRLKRVARQQSAPVRLPLDRDSIPRSRRQRAAAPRLPLPDLTLGLQEYRRRLTLLAATCRSQGQRCLFLTQPSIYRDDLAPEETALLWLGWVGGVEHPKGYVSASEMRRALDAYNGALLDLCRENDLECVDLASQVPRDRSAFFDDCHFTKRGAELVARSVADHLLSKPPFAQ